MYKTKTKAELKRIKAGYADSWQGLIRQAHRAAWKAATARGEDCESQSVYDFEDAIPYSPAHWNEKRRAKAVATGLLDTHDQILCYLDVTAELFRATAATLKGKG